MEARRASYYTTVQGDEPKLATVREALWSLGFEPNVFKKPASAPPPETGFQPGKR